MSKTGGFSTVNDVLSIAAGMGYIGFNQFIHEADFDYDDTFTYKMDVFFPSKVSAPAFVKACNAIPGGVSAIEYGDFDAGNYSGYCVAVFIKMNDGLYEEAVSKVYG